MDGARAILIASLVGLLVIAIRPLRRWFWKQLCRAWAGREVLGLRDDVNSHRYVSVLKVASLVALAIAMYLMAAKVLSPGFLKDVSFGSASDAGTNKAWVKGSVVFLFFVFAGHLFRVYLSMQMIEHDPAFYNAHLKELTSWKRGVEYWIRILILCVVLSCIHWGTLDFSRLQGIVAMASWALAVYIALFAWDMWMLVVTATLRWPRWEYLVADLVGGLMWYGVLWALGHSLKTCVAIAVCATGPGVLLCVYLMLDLIVRRDHYIVHVEIMSGAPYFRRGS